MIEKNRLLYERFMHLYSQMNLEAAEWEILKRLKSEWATIDMLDIGVGAGRTSYVFSAITRSYTGIDYALRSVDLCRRRIGENGLVRFVHCDARKLTQHFSETFDFIMFSQNGLDSVDHDDRLAILNQVRLRLKDTGYFFFSSHSLDAPPRRLDLPRFNPLLPGRSIYKWGKACVQYLQFKYANKAAFTPQVKKRGWTIFKDNLGNRALELYCIAPAVQLRQLEEAGFQVISVYNLKGKPIDCTQPHPDLWLHYLCRPRKTAETIPHVKSARIPNDVMVLTQN